MNKKCEIIRDLLPMYIDDLTSKGSDELIKEHVVTCSACKEYYHNLKETIPEFTNPEITPFENTEHDLLKKIKRKIFIGAAALMIFFLSFGVLIGIFGDVIFQEGNPVHVVGAIIKLESKDVEYVQFSDMPIKFITKSNIERENMISEYMAKNNWTYKEQLGSSYIFTRNNEEVSVSGRQFTRSYLTWEVPAESTLEN